jgi:hypothetical protein
MSLEAETAPPKHSTCDWNVIWKQQIPPKFAPYFGAWLTHASPHVRVWSKRVSIGFLCIMWCYGQDSCTPFLLFDLFDRLSVQQQSTASMIFWSLWKSCNTKLWEGASCTFINVPQPLKEIHHLYKKIVCQALRNQPQLSRITWHNKDIHQQSPKA